MGELIAANVTPTSQEVQLSVAEPTVANILVANTGMCNPHSKYGLMIHWQIMSNFLYLIPMKLLAPGTDDVFQIEITALEGAIADDEHKATAWISSRNVNLSADRKFIQEICV